MFKYILCMLVITGVHAKVQVVTTLSDYKIIAQKIGQNKIEVKSIVHPNEDPHHVRPKPSYAKWIRDADLFITTGLDLELWVPALLNRAGNTKVRSGQIGYVAASAGIPLMEKPKNLSHSEGGLHLYGNPHITTSPLNMLYIGKNIATGLSKVDPENKRFYKINYDKYHATLMKNIFGTKLLDLLDEGTLLTLAESGALYSFLDKKKLSRKLGGWFLKAKKLRGARIVSYHKNWGYLFRILNIQNVACIEVKPGVPPTPNHVLSVINKMRDENLRIIVGANYFSETKMKSVAKKVDAKLVTLQMGVSPKHNDIMNKFDAWVAQLSKGI